MNTAVLNTYSQSGSRLVPENVISLWSFEDNNNDSIGTNHGTTPGVEVYNPFRIGKGKDFNATDAHTIIPNNLDLSFTDGMNDVPGSISMIAHINGLNVTQFFASKRGLGTDGSVQCEWDIVLSSSNILFWRIFDSISGNNIRVKYENYTPNPYEYQSIIATTNGNGLASGMNLYVNGVNVGVQETLGTYVKTHNYNNNLVLGNNSWNYISTQRHRGNGDEYKKWKIELTPEEAMYLATEELAGRAVI